MPTPPPGRSEVAHGRKDRSARTRGDAERVSLIGPRPSALWLCGGVTRLGGEAKTPKEAFLVAVLGPLMRLTLAAVFASAAYGLGALGAAHIILGLAGGSRASTCYWACSICFQAPRWMAAGS